MEIGDLIAMYRKQAGMTIDELAEASGVPKGTLNKIIGGITKAPTLDTMKSISRALGKTLADFDDMEKASEPDESDTEAIAVRLYNVLLSSGFLKPGQDLTDRQLEVLDGISAILSATFDELA